jgi:hypothetical protein
MGGGAKDRLRTTRMRGKVEISMEESLPMLRRSRGHSFLKYL